MEDVLKIPAPVPGFDELGEALGRIGGATRAAEWHGMLCGRICVQCGVDEESCLRELVGEREVVTQPRGECWALLRALIRDTLGQFGPQEWGFYPLLPDDDEPLSVRGAALREWCQGILDGLSAAAALSGDCREIVDDITRIAGLTISGVRGDEDEEVAFVEIVEYLRVGVLLIHEQLQGGKRATGWPEGVN